jgi:hypothetical protein
MARLWSCGFELQSVTPNVECTNFVGTGFTINTTTKHSGESSLKITKTVANNAYIVQDFPDTSAIYTRCYLNISSAPGDDASIVMNFDGSLLYERGSISLTPDRKLKFSYYNSSGNFVSTAAGSTVLDTGTWYRIELYLYMVSQNTVIYDVKINGNTELSSTGLTVYNNGYSAIARVGWGLFNYFKATTGTLYFDDLAVNDGAGTSQNSWCGAGSIVHMQVDGNGDVQEQNAGDWDELDDVTPDDASYIELDDNNDDVLFTLESSANAGITAGSTINVVQVGYRHRPETAAASGFTPYLEGQASGTLQYGTAFTHNDTNWKTNGDVWPRLYKLTSYTNPQDSAAWETTDLDTMQIGGICTDANPDFWISSMWALVDYNPPTATQKAISDNITFTDDLGKDGNRVSVDTISFTDSLAQVTDYVRDITDTVSFTDIMAYIGPETITHTPTDVFDFSESYVVNISRVSSDTITLSDSDISHYIPRDKPTIQIEPSSSTIQDVYQD